MKLNRETKMQLLLSLLMLCLLHVHPTHSGEYLLPEYKALLSVKSSITHDPQSALSTWNASTSHCIWSGITCHPSRHRVTALDLSGLDLSGTLSPDLAHLRFLEYLDVSQNKLRGPIPQEIGNLTNLKEFNIGASIMIEGGDPKLYEGGHFNMYEGGIPSGIWNLLKLVSFQAIDCNLSGEVPPEIKRLQKLETLHLQRNTLSGPLTVELKHLVNLKSMVLSYNLFTGAIPEFIGDMPELEVLQLVENNFTGIIPQRLGKNGKLLVLDLSGNNLTGTLPPDMCFGNRLEILNVEGNSLVGPIPDSLGRCESLSHIRMGHNSLNGSIPRDLFGLPNLTEVMLRNNNLTGKLPIFSINNSKLTEVDISDNKIHGELPCWIWTGTLPNLENLNLSNNCLETLDVNLNSSQTSVSSLRILDLHSNQLQGQLSTLPLDFRYLYPKSLQESWNLFISVSRNKFDGAIPTSLCKAKLLKVLDLSHNHLTGKIPQCLIAMTNLSVMDLGGNNLTGVIPDSFSNNLCVLQTLILNGNQLEGELPKSLAKCNLSLEVLDVGNNRIQDTFPCYLKNMHWLRVLILRSNQFYGSINCLDANISWSRLQILDLASNHFVGKFPIHYFSSWKTMMGTENKTEELLYMRTENKTEDLQYIKSYDGLPYQITVRVGFKGQDCELKKILIIFTSLDLSCNNFDGHIPAKIGEFKALYALNLSHNAFTGQIPQALGNLSLLESLDLSSNKLIGEIPHQLADGLIFLSVLNLSFNQLVGKIPQIKQFPTFPESSFEGNIRLCDFPLKEKCIHEELGPSTPPSKESPLHFENSIDWNFSSVELGFVFGFGIFIGPLIFWKRWRKCYYKCVDDIVFKLFPWTYIRIENHRRRAHRNQGRQACRT